MSMSCVPQPPKGGPRTSVCSRPIPLCAYKKAKTGEAPMGEELLVSAQAGCEYARRLLCEELLQRAKEPQ